MASRAQATVYEIQDGAVKASKTTVIPDVFRVHVRPDLVQEVVQRLHLNLRQAYAVSDFAGYQHAAESWGTGRAVARVPRVTGRGSHKSGQAAFANFCRGGGMFAPTKTYRKWTRQTPLNVRRHVQAYGVAATGTTSLVAARGHKVSMVPELPLVVSESIGKITKTKDMVKALNALGLGEEIARCAKSKKLRASKGKNRNRQYRMAKGVLIIYKDEELVKKTAGAIPGVEVMCVDHLDSRKLAPGGHVGRLTVYTERAFQELNNIFGDVSGSPTKGGYKLPRKLVTADSIHQVINSEAIQSVVRPAMVDQNPVKPHDGYPNLLKAQKK